MAYTQCSKTMCHIFTVALSPLLSTFSCALGYDMDSLYVGAGMEYSQASGGGCVGIYREDMQRPLYLCVSHLIFTSFILYAFAIVSMLVMSSDTFNRQR